MLKEPFQAESKCPQMVIQINLKNNYHRKKYLCNYKIQFKYRFSSLLTDFKTLA